MTSAPPRGLLDLFSTYRKEKLAVATAPHLDREAKDTRPAPQSGIDILKKVVDPAYTKVVALGAAWPQLAQASSRNHRVIVLPLELTGLTRADTKKGVVLTNPSLEVVDATLQLDVDFCLTFPGWGGEYTCPTTARISADELPEPVLLSKESTRGGFHEVDHLNRMNSIKRAREQRRRLFFRPPEERKAWNEMRNAGQLDKWPWQIDLSQGGFDYATFRREVLDLEKYMKSRHLL